LTSVFIGGLVSGEMACRRRRTGTAFDERIEAVIVVGTPGVIKDAITLTSTTMTTRTVARAAGLLLFPALALGGDVVSRGEARASLAPFDELMTSFLAEHDVAGAALAVTRRGRLVLARGYGIESR
jgi:hypothetical protein